MDSRKRLKITLNHKEADRIPIDLGGTCVTTLTTVTYNNLRKYIGINSKLAKMHNFNEQLGYPEKEFFDKFLYLDVIDCSANFLKSDNDWKEFELSDGSKCLIPYWINLIDEPDKFLVTDDSGFVLAIKPKKSLYLRQTYWALENLEHIPDEYDFAAINKNMWASITLPPLHLDIFNDEQYKIFIKNIKELHDTDTHALSLR